MLGGAAAGAVAGGASVRLGAGAADLVGFAVGWLAGCALGAGRWCGRVAGFVRCLLWVSRAAELADVGLAGLVVGVGAAWLLNVWAGAVRANMVAKPIAVIAPS